jgi:hypothetical protein
MKWCRFVRLVAVIFCFNSNARLLANEDELLQQLLEGHRAGKESIRTMHCKVEVQGEKVSKGQTSRFSYSGEYWRTLDAIRIRTVENGKVTDVVVRSGEQTTLERGKPDDNKQLHASITPARSIPAAGGDPWRVGLLYFRFGSSSYPLEELIKQPHKQLAIKWVNDDGRKLLCLEMASDQQLKVWFDPSYNYLACRKNLSFEAHGKTETESRVVNFKEVGPGILFPERIESEYKVDGTMLSRTTAVIRDAQVNHSISDSELRIKFPTGTSVSDAIRKKVYSVDEDGHVIKEDPTYTVGTSVPLEPASSVWREQTQEETPSSHRWLLPASLILLICGLGLWLWQRTGSRSRTKPGQ